MCKKSKFNATYVSASNTFCFLSFFAINLLYCYPVPSQFGDKQSLERAMPAHSEGPPGPAVWNNMWPFREQHNQNVSL